MTERTAMDEIKRTLVEETRTDAVGLWAVLWEVKRAFPSLSAEEAKQITLTVIREGLIKRDFLAGHFSENDDETLAFSEWGLLVEETMARVEREWVALGREPTLGDVVWFVNSRVLPLVVRKHPMGKGWKPSRG